MYFNCVCFEETIFFYGPRKPPWSNPSLRHCSGMDSDGEDTGTDSLRHPPLTVHFTPGVPVEWERTCMIRRGTDEQ